MNLSAIVEVAIGIIFVWIVLSLTTIQIQEWINTRLDKRAKDMEDAIHEMLANPNLKAQFYDHPVIRGLTAKKRRKPSEVPRWYYRWPIVKGFTREKRKLPSYIPAQQFALALFDIALTAGTESSFIQQGILKIRDDLQVNKKLTVYQAVIEELNLLAEFARSAAATEAKTAITQRDLPKLRERTKNFIEDFKVKYPRLTLDKEVEDILKAGITELLERAPELKAQVQDLLRVQSESPSESAPSGNTEPEIQAGTSPQAGPKSESALSKVRRGVAALSVISPEVHQTLNALLMNVEEYVIEKESKLAKARGNVERWFDDSMDRVSGVYKRYSQFQALIIGLLIALLVNVDSISLTLYLWREPSIRAVLATKAQEFDLSMSSQATNNQTNNPYDAMQNFREQFTGLNLPVGCTLKDHTDPLFTDPQTDCELIPKRGNYFGVPFYKYGITNSLGFLKNKCLMPTQPEHSTNILLKLFGIGITAIAARQGAPFWFDLLKRLVNLRGTGANPAEKEGK